MAPVAGQSDEFEHESNLAVARGLHIFRYVTYQGAGSPAVATLIPSSDAVTLMDMPGRSGGSLRKPGDCLAVRVDRACDVIVGLRRGSPNGVLDAQFRLEPIVLSEQLDEVEEAPKVPISFRAHLSRVGDIAFGQDTWAGGPDAPAAVEGLEIVDEGKVGALELQVLVAGRPPRWSEWVGAGRFAGTRGRGLPLLGVRLRLTPSAANAEISAEALFLGSLVGAQRGPQVEFISSSGVDPLVGLKIGIQGSRAKVGPQVGPSDEGAAKDREPRVRVFRASSNR